MFFAHPSETDLGIVVIVGNLSLLLKIFLQIPAHLIGHRLSAYSLQLFLH